MQWGADGSMYIGQSNRGWNSLGTKSYGLQRLQWTGKVPFEIKEMSAQKKGFRLTFTQPVDVASSLIKNFTMTSYTYPYHSNYGGEPMDVKTHIVKVAKIENNLRSLQLVIDEMRPGYVYELNTLGVRNNKGQKLLHSAAYYTLNRVPK